VGVEALGGVWVNGRRYPGTLSLIPRGGDKLDVLNLVELEAYVERSAASEVMASWPAEALKAQAIIARTYALFERQRRAREPYDLESSVLSQRYAVDEVPASVRDAVRETRGSFLSHAGAPILAAFHSSSGGRTASSEEVWGQDLPYLRPVRSPDEAAPDYFWRYEIRTSDLRAALAEADFDIGEDIEVRVLRRSASGRVTKLALGQKQISGSMLRQVLGGRAIRSTRFEVEFEGEWVRFMGSGAGHGVGLCQWGARELAAQGRSVREILEHYYPGTRLRKVEAFLDGRDRSGSE
jgi:stage II sporulation protein D